ncbi:MAG TPA: fused MFS/spermidine synthase [Methylomirabilota bacterium]|nr:fused MFS/spermidine synthase [Methylomirabilota bacterium]
MNPRWTTLLVLICFFLSGVAGLVYQVAWSRYLALFLGHTSYAVVAVLVAFMGGLAIGNAVLGRMADRIRKPLALYAWLEIGIGLYALLFPHYNQLVHSAYISAASQVSLGSPATVMLKFGFSLLTILLPTVLMGATFPALVRFVTHSLGDLRQKVALLYFINSAGAVAGALVAQFYWIRSLGLEATVYASAALNLGVGAVTLWWSARFAAPVLATREEKPQQAEETYSREELRLAVWGIGLSGFVAMLYEVAWTRLLALALGSSSNAFTIMLVTFITGIAVGAWIVSKAGGSKDSLGAFAWAELALAASVLGTMFFYDDLPFWFSRLANDISRRPESYYLYQAVQATICFVVMFIPSLCLGMTLPLVSRIATNEVARSGQSVGSVFAVNTLGTVLGAAVTGLWIMPQLGLARTFGLGLALNAFIGASILARRKGISISRSIIGAVVAAVALTFISGELFNAEWQRLFSTGLFRDRGNRKAYENHWQSSQLVYYKDGPSGSVAVMTTTNAAITNLSLKVNGKTDASTAADVPTQLLIAHIPLILKPDSSNVLIVGLGSGMTAGAALRHTNVVSVDTVELSREVAEGAAFFGRWNDDALTNPRHRIVTEDAKTFLQVKGKQYDVIVSEPSNPWMAGVAGVFTREYYQSCEKRLGKDGLMVQWVQLYEMADDGVKTILATFSSVFPYMAIWRGAGSDLILVGSRTEREFSLEQSHAAYQRGPVKSHLASFGLVAFPVFLAHEVVSMKHGAFLVPEDTLLHTDNFPVLEELAERGFFVGAGSSYVHEFQQSMLPRSSALLGRWVRERPLGIEDFKAFGEYYVQYAYPPEENLRSLLMAWQRADPRSTLPMEASTLGGGIRSRFEVEALQWAPRQKELIELAATDPHPLRLYTLSLIRSHRIRRSVFHVPDSQALEMCLERLMETDPDRARLYTLQLAEIAWDRGDDERCLKLGLEGLDPRGVRGARSLFEFDPSAPYQTLGRVFRILLERGDTERLTRFAMEANAAGWFGPNQAKPRWVELLQREIETMPFNNVPAPDPLPRL